MTAQIDCVLAGGEGARLRPPRQRKGSQFPAKSSNSLKFGTIDGPDSFLMLIIAFVGLDDARSIHMAICSVHITNAERRSRLVLCFSWVGLDVSFVTNVKPCIEVKRCVVQAVC